MPVIGFEPEATSHYCNLPDARSYPLGTVFGCDGESCDKKYRAQSVRDRGITNNEWVEYTGFKKLADLLPKKGETE